MAETKVQVTIGAKDEASGKLKTIGDNMTKMSGTFKKAGTVMLGMGAALGGGIVALTTKWAQAGDEVAKMSKRTGWAVESLSELRHVAEISGTELDAFEKGTRKLSMAIIDAAEGGQTYEDALNRIGLSGQSLMGMGIEDQFWAVANALSDVEDDTVKAATAMELFGRTGTQLFPMLEEGKDGIQKLRDEAHELGIVFDEEAAKNAEEFQDALTNLKTSLAGVGAQIASQLAPEITKFVDKVTAAVVLIKEWTAVNPQLVTGLKLAVAVLVGGGGLLLALSQISRAIIAINAALIIFHALSGPAAWAKLAAGLAIAAGLIYGMTKLMSTMGPTTPTIPGIETSPGVFQPPKAARGGIATRPTMAMVGEAGPEAIIPLSRGGFGDTFNITVMGNTWGTEDLVERLREEFLKIKSKNTTTGF